MTEFISHLFTAVGLIEEKLGSDLENEILTFPQTADKIINTQAATPLLKCFL
jgi:hypothetical protein